MEPVGQLAVQVRLYNVHTFYHSLYGIRSFGDLYIHFKHLPITALKFYRRHYAILWKGEEQLVCYELTTITLALLLTRGITASLIPN